MKNSRFGFVGFGAWTTFCFIALFGFSAIAEAKSEVRFNPPRLTPAEMDAKQITIYNGRSPQFLNTTGKNPSHDALSFPSGVKYEMYPSAYTSMMLNLENTTYAERKQIFMQNRDASSGGSGYENYNGHRGIQEINDRKADLAEEAVIEAWILSQSR